MAFILTSATASSAVATNGTFTVTVPNVALAGAVKHTGGHVMIVRSMATLFNFPNDFSVSWSGATATITYLGTTSIPAGSLIQVQFEVEGDNVNFPYHNKNSNQTDQASGSSYVAYRGSFGNVFRVDFGAPSTANATAVIGTRALATTTLNTFTAAEQVTATLPIPRTLAVKSSSASDDNTKIVTIRGYDEYGQAMTESFTMNGATAVVGLKAFKRVVSAQSDTTFVGTLSIGTNAGGWGLPYYLAADNGSGVGGILKESTEGATPTAGVPIGGVLTKATATTGDVRGTYTPNVTPDAAKVFSIWMFVADVNFLGVPQYAS